MIVVSVEIVKNIRIFILVFQRYIIPEKSFLLRNQLRLIRYYSVLAKVCRFKRRFIYRKFSIKIAPCKVFHTWSGLCGCQEVYASSEIKK
jgi:hypothetical protein